MAMIEIDIVEFHSYKSLREEFLGQAEFSNRITEAVYNTDTELKALHEANDRLWNRTRVMNEEIQLIRTEFRVLKNKVDRPWYKFW